MSERTLPWLALALLGCGAASSRAPIEAPAHAEAEPAPRWAFVPCTSDDGRAEVARIDGSSYQIAGRERIIVGERATVHASMVPSSPFALAAELGAAGTTAWFFVTHDGAILRAEGGFDGPLTQVAAVRGEVETSSPRSRAINALFIDAVLSSPWLFDPETGARPMPQPPDRMLLAAAVRWPDVIVELLEPGDIVISHDRGATFAPLSLGAHVAIDVFARDRDLVLELADGSTVVLGPDDTLGPVAPPEEVEAYYADGEDDEADQDEDQDAASSSNDESGDAWCGSSDVDARWHALGARGSVPEPYEDLPGCVVSLGEAFATAECASEDDPSQWELRLLEPSSGEFRVIGPLTGQETYYGGEPHDSVGSHTFAFPSAAGWLYYANGVLTPLTLAGGRLGSVHDDLGVLRIGESVSLVRLPSLTPVDLELPPGLSARLIAFAADGALLVVAPGIDDTHASMLVGSPGSWTRSELVGVLHDFALADAQHGVARVGERVLVMQDGATWTDLGLTAERGIAFCTRDACGIMSVGSFRVQPPGSSREVIATAPIVVEREVHWYYDETSWSCATPPATSFDDADDHVDSATWGYASSDEHTAAGWRTVAWTSIDARGPYRTHASLPAGTARWYQVLTLARTFAVVTGEDGQVLVASAHPHAVDLASLAQGEVRELDETALPDGGAVLVASLAISDIAAGQAVLFVRLDRNGAVSASHTFVRERDTLQHWGIAIGPGSLPALAMTGVAPHHWSIHPMDGSASLDFEVTLNPATPCAAPATWTIESTGFRVQARFPSGYEGSTTVVVGVGPESACVQAISPGLWSEPQAWPVVVGAQGQLHGYGLDDSAHGVTYACTTSSP